MLLMVLACPLPALGAEVTDMAPGVGALVGVHYGGSALSGHLVEDGQTVASRRIQRHDLDVTAEVSPLEGVAITLGFDTTPSLRFAYPDAKTMVSEPATGGGSYLAGTSLPETPVIAASGISGVWIGGAVAPIAERYAGTAGSTWRVDLAFRTPSRGNNLWTANDSGRRGVAPGGSALKVVGAFSSDRGVGNPYLQATYQREGAVSVDVVDESGREWGAIDLRPATTFDVRTGIEIVGYEAPPGEDPARFAVDVLLGMGYRSWEDIASGVYLPDVLDSGRGIPVTVGDHLSGRTGVALDYHVNPVVRGRTGFDFTYATPFRVEHVYDVRTSADTYTIGWFFTVQAAVPFTSPPGPATP